MAKATVAKGPLPAWAESVRRKYLGSEASLFVLHGNVFDELLWNDRFVSLPQFLSDVLLAGNKDTIIYFDPSAGARYLKRTAASDTKPLAADKPLDEALALLEQELFVRSSAGLIITYAGVVAPAGDDSLLAQADRLAGVRLHRWSMSAELSQKDNVVFLICESLAELNQKLVANPRVAAVRIPLPDVDTRRAVISKSDPALSPTAAAHLAEYTAGLRAVQIAQLLTPAPNSFGDAERRAFIVSLLGTSPDAMARAQKLAAITQGMSADEIRHLIDPATPKPSDDADNYAEIIELIYQRKREIIEKECAGLIEFVDARHGLEAVGGMEEIKAELMEIARAIKSGDKTRVPMGLLLVGPMGTGKTFVAKCFAKESGLSAVTLKNIRSKWVGATEANLEKVLSMVQALGPIILIIDEGDRSFGGGGESDGGTSSRVMARLKEFMSDPDNRGLVLFIMMTNRPDKLDIDIKRAGRLDRKIPFFYPEDPESVEAVLAALYRRHDLGALPPAESLRPISEQLVNYSNADLEAVCLLAFDLASRAGQTLAVEHLAAAAADYVPARDSLMLEYMEMLAVFEASRRSMLPARYRDLSQDEFNTRLQQLRLALNIR